MRDMSRSPIQQFSSLPSTRTLYKKMSKIVLNINECTTTEQLTLLPGIGQKTAAAILDEAAIRPFKSFEEMIERVKGLSRQLNKKRMKKINKKFELKFDDKESSPFPINLMPRMEPISQHDKDKQFFGELFMCRTMDEAAQMYAQKAGKPKVDSNTKQMEEDKQTMFKFLIMMMESEIVTGY